MTQLKIAFAIAVGFFVLLPIATVCKAWTNPPTFKSIKEWPSGTPNQGPHRPLVDEWSWAWLNAWYGNSEDGVSGQQAWVWSSDSPPVLVTYASLYPKWTPQCVIAFAWSAWRNNVNNLKRPLRSDSLTGTV